MDKFKISALVKKMMKTYKDYKYFLENKEFLEYINKKHFSPDVVQRRVWYCEYVQGLLNSLLPIEREILIEVYMNEKHPSCLHLSLATYYLKRNKLLEKLKDSIFIDLEDFEKNSKK